LIRFLHAADLHLDSPLRGLARYEGAPVEALHRALRGAVENLVQTAIDRRVSLVVIAGDVYDGDCHDYNTLLFFTRQMQRLAAEQIPVVLISGNHDAANKMTLSLKLPPNVTRLDHNTAETKTFDDLGIAVHGQGFATRDVFDNLASSYPAAVRGLYNIGLLHTCATGGEGHAAYAPCTLADLRAKDYDYWALGHIHTGGALSTEPHVVFPGNVQGRHIQETGAKGCAIVEVDGPGNAKINFCPLDVFRWQRIEVDVTDIDVRDDALAALDQQLRAAAQASPGMPMAARVVFRGATPLHPALAAEWPAFAEEVKNQAIQSTDGRLWIEKVQQRTTLPSAAGDQIDAALDGPLGELLGYLNTLGSDDAELADLKAEIRELASPLLKEFVPSQGIDWLREQLPAVEALLLGQLRSAEAPR
jgi:DNA repair exonuclease SbcCD nuclease subunit